jgi:hypothetical protein
MKRLLEDMVIGALFAAAAGAVLAAEKLRPAKALQIPQVPLDDMETEDAIMRRLDGNTLVPERPFDYDFWNKGMGW